MKLTSMLLKTQGRDWQLLIFIRKFEHFLSEWNKATEKRNAQKNSMMMLVIASSHLKCYFSWNISHQKPQTSLVLTQAINLITMFHKFHSRVIWLLMFISKHNSIRAINNNQQR